MIAQVITLFVIILVTISLIPVITTTLNSYTSTLDATDSANASIISISKIFPWMFVLLAGGIIIAVVATQFGKYGSDEYLIDNSESAYYDEEPEEKEHKQTYLEYVKERVTAEKLISRG